MRTKPDSVQNKWRHTTRKCFISNQF